uniref:hypothetical protein n=1 Tax=Algoriphagus sp. TaxID=1872435 RepID=UPI004047D316
MFQLIAVLSDSVLVHGNCLIHNQTRKAYIFTAHGGVGKTSMLLEALHKGEGKFEFGGDDLVWLSSKTMTALPYYRPMCIYNYHYRAFNEVFYNLKIRYGSPSIFYRALNLFMLNLRALVGKNSFTDFYNRKNIVPKSRYFLLDPLAFFDITQSGELDIGSIAYLERSNSVDQEIVDKSDLLSLILESTLEEFKEYDKVLDNVCYFLYKCSFKSYLKRVINKLLEGQNQYYKISSTGKWNIRDINRILEKY